ncbi:borealin-like [Lucilia sericata]|uniref:borealin-like n=1 Tax=Lucilia sericata TaxID=13632 RepID=UPI0018A8284C|nr:borealin-like [Lucilia sericata]
MPRTKVSKSSKRNRETTNREEKVREFENSLDGFQNTVDDKIQDIFTAYDDEIKMLLQRTPRALLKLKMVDVFSLDLDRFSDWEQQKSKMLNATLQNSSIKQSTRTINPNDEGYLTEDSSTGGSIGSAIANPAFLSTSNMLTQPLIQQQSARLRTPGPLSSARARRPRRSRSACGNLAPIPASAVKLKPQLSATAGGHGHGAAEHHSRSKMRTPMASRTKALSADRTTKFDNPSSPQSPPTFLRFPKPGELALSKCGSPLVTQMLPENIAHLNIPLRNGVISMRPKKLADLQPHILEDLDPTTVDQLRTLKLNIDKIVSMVDKAGY